MISADLLGEFGQATEDVIVGYLSGVDMLLAGHIARIVFAELVGLDAAGTVGEVVLTFGNLTDQIIADMCDLTVGVVGILVARVILECCAFCVFALGAVDNAGDAVEVIVLVLDYRAVAIQAMVKGITPL